MKTIFKKTAFVIIDSQDKILIEDAKLPIYWLKRMANNRKKQLGFGNVKKATITIEIKAEL